MISKESFCSLMDACEEYFSMMKGLDNMLTISPESKLYDLPDIVLTVLSQECEDYAELRKHKLDPILFDYTFQYAFGKQYNGKFLVELNGEKFAPSSSAELYDLLLAVYAKQEDK